MSAIRELAARQKVAREDKAKVIVEKRKIMYACAAEANKSLLASVNDGVAKLHHNEKILEADAKKLHEETAAFVRQTSQSLDMYKRLNSSMNDLGEVETWAKRMQAEMRTVASSLEYVSNVERRGVET